MTGKIFRSALVLAVVVLLSSLGVVMGVLYDHFDGIHTQQLSDELTLAAAATEQNGTAFLNGIRSDRFRLTWIAADGTVICDTRADEDTMENHADREEFRQALESGFGSSARYSQTLTEVTRYQARRLSDGTVLRVSMDHASSAMLVLDLLRPILLVALLAVILSALLASRMAKRIVEPLNRLDLEHPLENDAYEELAPMLHRLNQQHSEIYSHMKALQRRHDEFTQITESMSEGLVLLDKDRHILSINPAAGALFGADQRCLGRDFLSIDRNPALRSLLDTAFGYGVGNIQLSRGGRDYRLSANRIESGGRVIGTVLLAIDITESLNAERNRREFSANVSHELKTPLQSILGGAELLESGLVKPEDVPSFLSRIRQEAARLVSLVEDIIRLSQLDEGVALPMEETDLHTLAGDVLAALEGPARAKGVTLSLTGDSCPITGCRRLLYEIISNLCDNAVKYNVPGGSVTVSLSQTGDGTRLTVADTGIGIPEAHQARIFERFYRVDKSHSRQSGGTGLGLSIVKHAVQLHGGKIELTSQPGTGTTVTVIFPK